MAKTRAVLDEPPTAGTYVEPRARRSRAIEQVVDIAIAVLAEPDVSALVERILLEARRLTNAQAGTLFLRRGGDLVFTAVQNDSLAQTMSPQKMTALFTEAPIRANEHSVVGWVSCSGATLNIPEVEAIPSGAPYAFNRAWDVSSGYRTHSILVMPLTGRGGNNLGALELINALDEDGRVIPFDAADERIVRALATQAAVAVDHARLTELSLVDPVTGAFNRRYFGLRLEEEIKRYKRHQQPFAVVMFDLDHFKRINDEYGHLTGDRALQTTSSLVSGQSRGFTVLARLGGDEFAAILPSTPKTGAVSYAERIRRLIETYPFDGHALTVTAGVASVPDDVTLQDLTADAITDAADRALYEAKRNGRNRTGTL